MLHVFLLICVATCVACALTGVMLSYVGIIGITSMEFLLNWYLADRSHHFVILAFAFHVVGLWVLGYPLHPSPTGV